MSIASELSALQTDITNARTAITTKGGTVTSGGGSSQLATDIATIPSGGGGISFNIAYDDTAPADTSKLWIKGNSANKVNVKGLFNSSHALNNTVTISATDAYFGATVGQNIFIFAGTSAYKYDTTNDTLNAVATLPLTMNYGACGVYGNYIYLICGAQSSSSSQAILKFNTLDYSITTLSVTCNTVSSGYATVGNKIYIFAGKVYNTAQKYVKIFDCESETISTINNVFTSNTSNLCAAPVDTDIYIFGGTNNSFKIQKFNTLTQELNDTGVVIPVGVFGLNYTASSFGTDIYIFNNYDNNKICKFDAINQTVSEVSGVTDTFTSYGAFAATVGNKIYIISGGGADKIRELSILIPLNQNEILLKNARLSNELKLINSSNCEVDVYINQVLRGNTQNLGEVAEAYIYKNGQWTLI